MMKSEILIGSSIFIFLIFLSPAVAQEARVWTDKSIYSEGEYVKVFVELPYIVDSCEGYLITPQGNEIPIGPSVCGPFIHYKTGELVQRTHFTTFVTSLIENNVEYGYLRDNFGIWGIKIIVKKDGQIDRVLNTSFEYKYFNKIVGTCTLENTKSKNCTFLDSVFEVTRDGGCGPYPVTITISYFGGTKTLSLAEGDSEMLDDSILVINRGSSCGEGILHLRFDKFISPEETSLKVSTESIEAKIGNESKSFSLPTEEKTLVIEGRVDEMEKSKKINILIDNVKNVLILESANVSADTELPIGIETAQLYVEVNGTKSDVNILPDTAAERAKAELTSIESIELIGGSALYLIKGLKNGETKEVKIDARTGQLITEEKVTLPILLATAIIIALVLILVVIYLIKLKVERKNI